MTKKQQRSALYYFAKEQGDRARRSASIKDLIEEFYPRWQSMTPDQKAPYERMYEDWKRSLKLSRNDDFNQRAANVLASMSSTATASKTDSMKKETEQMQLTKYLAQVAEATPTLDSQDEIIKQQHWYIVKFTMFCKSELNPYKNCTYEPYYYVLGEVAIVEYSIGNGITNTFHAFLKQNEIPLGYRSQCMESSRDVHQIPLGEDKLVNYDYPEVYEKMREFMSNGTITVSEQDGRKINIYPPLFSLSRDLEETQFGMQFLFDRFSEANGVTRQHTCPLADRVLPLEGLYVYLLQLQKISVSLASALDDLTAYTYDYAADTACEFHDTKGNVIHCAQGICKRFCYLMSENLGSVYNIEHTGNHFPIEKAAGIVGSSLLNFNVFEKKGIKSSAMDIISSGIPAKRSTFNQEYVESTTNSYAASHYQHQQDARSEVSTSSYARSVAASSQPTVTVGKSVASRWASDTWNRAPISQVPLTTSVATATSSSAATSTARPVAASSRDDDEPSNYSTQTYEALDHTLIPSDDWTSAADPRFKSVNYRNALSSHYVKKPDSATAGFKEVTNRPSAPQPPLAQFIIPPSQKPAMSSMDAAAATRPKGRGRGFIVPKKA